MNYLKHYTLLIERARSRSLHGPKERHHILPCCVFRDKRKSKIANIDKNLVWLTPREHFVAHALLCKVFRGCEWGQRFNYIIYGMCNMSKKPTSRIYSIIREKINGKTMMERIGDSNYVDPRKGKSAKEIYGDDYTCYKSGKTNVELFGEEYVDPRKGKSAKEIYGEDWIDPRSKPFILCTPYWKRKFDNFKECRKDGILCQRDYERLMRDGEIVIKRVTKNARHPFKKGDKLSLEKVKN